MRKGLRTGRDWGTLCHLDWLWGDYPRLLDLQLNLFLLEGVADALSMLATLFSLEGFCAGERDYEITRSRDVGKTNTDRVPPRRGGIWPSFGDLLCSRLAYHA